ncbi:MAG TPA: DUF1080 domain-containing protein [Humisphaera sp.]
MTSRTALALLISCLAAASLLAASPTPPATAPAWTSLTATKSLDELWTTQGTAIWKLEDGVITGGQGDDPKRSGLLVTKASYQDFELDLEFQIDEHGKYNSGVYLRCQPGDKGRLKTGYQVNIGRGVIGEFCGGVYINEAWLAKGDEKDAIRKPREWNRLRIVAKGAHLVVDLNGVNVVDVTDPKPAEGLLKAGPIALQTYGAEGHAGWVKFRNVRIRGL